MEVQGTLFEASRFCVADYEIHRGFDDLAIHTQCVIATHRVAVDAAKMAAERGEQHYGIGLEFICCVLCDSLLFSRFGQQAGILYFWEDFPQFPERELRPVYDGR